MVKRDDRGPDRRRAPGLFARSTAQRQAVLGALDAATRALTPLEILEAARAKEPNLSLPTVYRTLKRCVQSRQAALVAIPGQTPLYERFRSDDQHQFFCRACSRAFRIADCPDSFVKCLPHGFRLERHDLFLYGRCASCA
jgi:Fur family ferric uptake transcriptional regulator